MADYDVQNSIEMLEEYLINGIIKGIKNGTLDEDIEAGDIKSWQKKQLAALQKFKKENQDIIGKYKRKDLKKKIKELLSSSFEDGGLYTERAIIKAIKKNLFVPRVPNRNAGDAFSGLNNRKLRALINDTTNKIYKSSISAVRYANDSYRKIIFNANVFFQTGTETLPQAIDRATHDFLSNGINCVEYKNGAHVNIASYSEMELRTANKIAYLEGEGAMREEYGLSLVIVTRRGTACPKCIRYLGKVFNDDVYSSTVPDARYPLLSTAIAGGLYHPNCKDSHTTYFPGITEIKPPTKAEIEKANYNYQLEQQQRYNERNIRKYKTLEAGSIDEHNVEKYTALRKKWQKTNAELIKEHPELRRDYRREKIY